MKFVAQQLDLQALHRVRERLVSQRTGIINLLATPPDVLSPRLLRIIEDLACDWRWLDERVAGFSNEIEAIARQDTSCERQCHKMTKSPLEIGCQACSSSNSNLASFKSCASNPSVNQP